MDQPMPESIEGAIRAAYSELVGADGDAPVAVRSSATAEDTSCRVVCRDERDVPVCSWR